MNILALDFGLKRIGTAVGSTESGIAFPREVLMNDDTIWEKLQQIISTDAVSQILVGMPNKRDNAPGDIQRELDDFVTELKARFGLPVEFMNERYTSKIAHSKLRDIGMSDRDQRSVADSVAAQGMLQEWLDCQA